MSDVAPKKIEKKKNKSKKKITKTILKSRRDSIMELLLFSSHCKLTMLLILCVKPLKLK